MTRLFLKYYILIAVCFLHYKTPAQETEGSADGRWSLGVALHPGIMHKLPERQNKFRPYIMEDPTKPMLSYAGGLRFIYSLSEHSGFEASALLIRRGFNYPREPLNQGIYYLDVPIMYRRKLFQLKNTKIFAASGIGPSILLYESWSALPIYKDASTTYYDLIDDSGIFCPNNQCPPRVYDPALLPDDRGIITYYNKMLPVGLNFHGAVRANLKLGGNLTLEAGPGFQLAMNSFTRTRSASAVNAFGEIELPESAYKYKYFPWFLSIDLALYFINR